MSEEQEEFIDTAEVAEVVEDEDVDLDVSDDDEEIPEEYGEAEDDEQYQQEPNPNQNQVEIDLSNNSSSYFDSHQDSVYLVASHPSLPMVITGGGDNLAYLWTTHSSPSRLVSKLTGFTESVVAGAFTADGSYVVAGDMSGQIRVWHAVRKGEVWDFFSSAQEVPEVVWIRTHPKLPTFAVGSSDGSVWCYDLEPTLATVAVLSSHAMAVNAGAYIDTANLDALTLITVSEDSTIVCWNIYMGSAIYTLGPRELRGEHPWVSLAVSPSERSVAAGSNDGFLVLINAADGNVLTLFDTINDDDVQMEDRSIEALAWSEPSVRMLAAGHVSGEIQLYEVGTWKVRHTLKLADSVTQMQFVTERPYILVTSCMDGTVAAWDVRSGQQVWVGRGHNEGVLGFAIQNDGRRLITAGDEGVSLVFNVE